MIVFLFLYFPMKKFFAFIFGLALLFGFSSSYDIIINWQVVDTETAPHDIIINLSTGVNWSYYDSWTQDFIVWTATYLEPVYFSPSVYVNWFEAFQNLSSDVYINTSQTFNSQNLNILNISWTVSCTWYTWININHWTELTFFTWNNFFINSWLSLSFTGNSAFITTVQTINTIYDFSWFALIPTTGSLENIVTQNPFKSFMDSFFLGVTNNLKSILIFLAIALALWFLIRMFRPRRKF